MYNRVHLLIIFKYIVFDVTVYIYYEGINYGRFISVYQPQVGDIMYHNKFTETGFYVCGLYFFCVIIGSCWEGKTNLAERCRTRKLFFRQKMCVLLFGQKWKWYFAFFLIFSCTTRLRWQTTTNCFRKYKIQVSLSLYSAPSSSFRCDGNLGQKYSFWRNWYARNRVSAILYYK